MISWNLLKCAFGLHVYGNPIKNETLNTIEKFCVHCNKLITTIKKDELISYQTDKLEIINDINLDKLCHAKQRLDILLKKLGY